MTRDVPAGAAGEYVEIGFIRKPVGLRGWCGVTPHGATLERLDAPCEVFLGIDPGALETVRLREVRDEPKGCRCLFEGCEDRDAAERLRDKSIYVRGDALPRLAQSRYYHFELEGLRVVAEQGGAELGIVRRVQNYPSVDALEIAGTDGRMVLVPLRDEIVRDIDREAGCITIAASNLDELFE
ncbi:MAG: 16S rRNA processing protein RimM [Chitinivibrionales bacterium]|nr:16S rRNA processing protein RimM [Chitinivibrionales bacterium]MBD3394140.1 16S rRNA processing protein RimM [Chitinivibrionales bacterium]